MSCERTNVQVLRNCKAGRQKGMTLEEWAEMCDYSCWCGYALTHGCAEADEAMVTALRTRCNPDKSYTCEKEPSFFIFS